MQGSENLLSLSPSSPAVSAYRSPHSPSLMDHKYDVRHILKKQAKIFLQNYFGSEQLLESRVRSLC